MLKIIVIKESGSVGRGGFNNQIPKECAQLVFHFGALVVVSFLLRFSRSIWALFCEWDFIWFISHSCLFISCQSSSICRAAIHYGILDNKGGLVDITRKGRTPAFVKSTRNGVESFRYCLHPKIGDICFKCNQMFSHLCCSSVDTVIQVILLCLFF